MTLNSAKQLIIFWSLLVREWKRGKRDKKISMECGVIRWPRGYFSPLTLPFPGTSPVLNSLPPCLNLPSQFPKIPILNISQCWQQDTLEKTNYLSSTVIKISINGWEICKLFRISSPKSIGLLWLIASGIRVFLLNIHKYVYKRC